MFAYKSAETVILLRGKKLSPHKLKGVKKYDSDRLCANVNAS